MSRYTKRFGTHPTDDGPDGEPEDADDPFVRYANYHCDADEREDRALFRRGRAGRQPGSSIRRLVKEGRSGRFEADRDLDQPAGAEAVENFEPPELPFSSYDVAAHGPSPVPGWLVTDLNARDRPLGALKSGKEADVSLLDRSVPGGPGCLLAVKTYRSTEHRMFHRDSEYLDGRRTRRSRETRAMANRSQFGRDLLAGRWAAAEFNALGELFTAGGRVPYPVQLIGSELMMEFVGGSDGTAAPRLTAHEATTREFTDLWHDLVRTLETLAQTGHTHGDLSPYNVLATADGAVVIDLPQVVDLIANPSGQAFLERDCRRIADFFKGRGVLAADAVELADHLWLVATGSEPPPPAHQIAPAPEQIDGS